MNIRKLVTVRYVGHTQNHGSGHMVRCAGFPGRRIPYNHGAQDPGQDAAHTYARDVLLKQMADQAEKHGHGVTFMPACTQDYALPNGGEAYVLSFHYVEPRKATGCRPLDV